MRLRRIIHVCFFVCPSKLRNLSYVSADSHKLSKIKATQLALRVVYNIKKGDLSGLELVPHLYTSGVRELLDTFSSPFGNYGRSALPERRHQYPRQTYPFNKARGSSDKQEP